VNVTFLGAARESRARATSCAAATEHSWWIAACSKAAPTLIAGTGHGSPSTPKAIEFVLLTHAFIDHSGLLPRLVRMGYRGPIYATPATCDLLEVMLTDAAVRSGCRGGYATEIR
jgi:metallo-beta-lactamase family protein